MSQISVGKLLPNLKVTLGNETFDMDSSSDAQDVTVDSKVEVVRPSIETLINPKVYINKDGGFATGIDLLEQENSGILSKRAERFGLDIEEDKPSISSLYDSMDIDIKNRDSRKMRHIRLDAIHVRGVEEFSTEEVFTYFQDYGPSSIEWINDSSCNVLWFDETSCARALLGLSKPLPATINSEIMKILNNSDEPDISSLKLKDNKEAGEEMEVDSSTSDVEVNIPVPPGRWRIGVPHSKAGTILLRFATRADKKVPGAEKRSKFYKKYGNPNYGGLKGLISNSRKQKSQAAANRWAVEKESSYKSSFSSHQSSSSTSLPKSSKKKTIRMRMYADDEELKTKKLRSKGQRKGSVHSRLGAKYTAEDLCRLGSYRDYDSPQEQDDYNFKPRKSSWDLRSKLKQWRTDSIRKPYSRENNRSDHRESASAESIKQYKRVEDLKKERRSFYKRKHRSPLCADEDDDDDSEESSTSDD